MTASQRPSASSPSTPELARTAKVRAARLDKRDSDVIEEALRAHLGIAALDEAQQPSSLSEDEALELANAEVHAARRERRSRVDETCPRSERPQAVSSRTRLDALELHPCYAQGWQGLQAPRRDTLS